MTMIELSICGCTSKQTDVNERKTCYSFTDMCTCINCENAGEDERYYENDNEFDTSNDNDYEWVIHH